MCNEKIRQEMKRSGIYCWQLADALNVAESTFYRMMRHRTPGKTQRGNIEGNRRDKAG